MTILAMRIAQRKTYQEDDWCGRSNNVSHVHLTKFQKKNKEKVGLFKRILNWITE
jgi:hypothetical protein